jgi:hypothetical protein
MRPFVVEVLDEVIELRLLLEEVLRRWLGGFLLERQMHPFVAAVLLRVAGFDALDADHRALPQRSSLRRFRVVHPVRRAAEARRSQGAEC